MKKRSAFLILLVIVLLLGTALPVNAEKASRGWMDLDFNAVGFANPDTPCPHVTWVGTVEVEGALYAISFEPTAPLTFYGDKLFFQELWRIHELSALEIVDGVVTRCDGPGLMWGTERGDARAGFTAKAEGYVVWVDPAGPFDESLVGRTSSWSGTYLGTLVDFAGPFQIS